MMGKKEVTLAGLMILFILSSTPAVEEEMDLTKIVVIGLEFRGGSLHQRSVDIAYNYPPDYKIPPTEGLTVEIRSRDNRLLKNFIRPDPRWVIISHAGLRYRENASFDLILPFVKGMDLIEIFDRNKSRLISVNLAEEVRSFCAERNGVCDPDCPKGVDPDCPTIASSTSTTESMGGGDDSLAYIFGFVVVFVAGFLIYRRYSGIRKMEDTREKREEMIEWIEKQLREGEDPEKLKTIVRSQGFEEELIDYVEKKLM
ncbi:MAG: hypothetical protein U9M95_03490 [Candidatus Altiarchaeota archaeon]|nr:hypothetical protein [Candidatus Altiarchaeota archaeon]